VVVSNGKIKLDFLPDAPGQFAILEIESKKNRKVLAEGASLDAPSAFCGDDFISKGSG
jgi:hypothetical protein